MPHDDDNDSAESAEDSFGSGGGFFDEPFDGGSTDSAEDAQDSFAGGSSGRDDDDDDDDDRNQNFGSGSAEDAQDSFAGGGSGGSDTQTPGESGQDTDATAPPEPPSIDPDLGDVVTGTEAREVLERVEREGAQIENLEERDALASQIERLTGVDARTVTRQFADEDVNVSLGPDGFAIDGTGDDPTGVGTQPPAPETPANEIDAPGSAEEAQDLAASGRLRNFTTASFGALDAPGSAEAAQDFAAGSAFGGTTRASLGALDRPGSAENAADLRSNDSVPSQAAFDEARTDPDALRDPTLAQGAQRQGRATVTEGFDVLFGSADEAVDRAADAADEGDLLGIADNLLGSTDEAFARGNEADDPVESIDEVLGPTDEVAGQVARSIATFAEDAPGVASDFSQSQSEIEQDQLDLATSGEFQAAFRLPISRAEEQITSAEADEGVLEQVTSGGLLDEEEERILSGASSRVIEAAGDEFDARRPETEFDTTREEQRELVTAVAGLANPFGLAAGAESGLEVATGSAEAIGDDEGGALFDTVQDVGSATVPAVGRQFDSDPSEFILTAGAGVVLGAGAGRVAGSAVTSAANRARAARVRAGGGEIFDVDELSDPPTQTEGLELPGFTEEAQADAEVAREEFIEQARISPLGGDDPTAVTVRASSDVREFGGFGSDPEAPEGSSEVPGQFFSADISNLRTPGDDGAGSGVSQGFSLPSLPGRGARVLAERDVDVDIAPAGDTSDLGRFLAEEADRSQSFIRRDSDGGPTPEQEVIAPPGARFTTEGDIFGVRVGGRSILGRDFGGEILLGRQVRRVDTDDTDADIDADTQSFDEIADETTRALRRGRERQSGERQPFVPTPVGVFASSSSRRESQRRSSAASAAASSSVFEPFGSEGFGSSGSSTGAASSSTGFGSSGSSTGAPSSSIGFGSSTSGTPTSSTPGRPTSTSTPTIPTTPTTSSPPTTPTTPGIPGPPDTDPDEEELELLDRLDEAFAGVRAVDTTLAPTEVDFDE